MEYLEGDRNRVVSDGVFELEEDVFADRPLKRPRTVLRLSKQITKAGVPRMRLERYLQTYRYADHDGAIRELRTLNRRFHFAITYDQLNAASLAVSEVLVRRWQSIMDAHAKNPWPPEGYDGVRTTVAPSLRHIAARDIREEAEIEVARSRASNVGLPPADASDGGGRFPRGKKGERGQEPAARE